jgi:hypothetical protein
VHLMPDDQVVKLFEQMSRSVDSLFRKYQYDTTPEERELLRHLYLGICQDLDAVLDEVNRGRLMLPPKLGASGTADLDKTDN